MHNKRRFKVATSTFRFPQGRSVQDQKNIEMVASMYKKAFQTDDVNVSFGEGPNGEPLLAEMFVSAGGPFVSLASLDSDVAHLVGDLIEDLADGKDASGTLDELKSKATGGGDSEKSDDPFGGKDDKDKSEKPEKSEKSDGGDKAEKEDSGAKDEGNPFAGAGGEPQKPRLPFASRNRAESVMKTATQIQRRYGLPLKLANALVRSHRDPVGMVRRASAIRGEYGIGIQTALDLVKEADRARTFDAFHRSVKRAMRDEDGRALRDEEYVVIGALAKGIDPKAALAKFREASRGGSPKGASRQGSRSRASEQSARPKIRPRG